jgi:hypothetical protein
VQSETNITIRRHLQRFFAGHNFEEHVWALGPASQELPELRVAEIAPGAKSELWLYATIGAWSARSDPTLEFIITAPEKDIRHVELATMSAWYHGRERLGVGHTFPIGQPWLPDSLCEYFMVSLPYPFGPDLEVCNISSGQLRFLWLLPITLAEREFKIREGQEALERRFDEWPLPYWHPLRPSVV